MQALQFGFRAYEPWSKPFQRGWSKGYIGFWFCIQEDLGVSKNQGPESRPQMVGPLLQGRPQKGPPLHNETAIWRWHTATCSRGVAKELRQVKRSSEGAPEVHSNSLPRLLSDPWGICFFGLAGNIMGTQKCGGRQSLKMQVLVRGCVQGGLGEASVTTRRRSSWSYQLSHAKSFWWLSIWPWFLSRP